MGGNAGIFMLRSLLMSVPRYVQRHAIGLTFDDHTGSSSWMNLITLSLKFS